MSYDKFGVPDTNNALAKPVQPKLGFKFRVFFTNIANNTVSSSIIEVTRNVIDCTLPNMSMEEVVIDSYNSRYYVQGKHTFDSITLNLRNDVSGEVAKVLGTQFAEQFNPYSQTHSATAGANKFQIKIQALDGGAENNGGDAPVVLQTWHLTGCWIQSLNWGSFNYTDSQPTQIALTIRYDNVFNSVLAYNGAGDNAEQGFANSIESTVKTSRYNRDSNTSAA
jgi:hypothetical protein